MNDMPTSGRPADQRCPVRLRTEAGDLAGLGAGSGGGIGSGKGSGYGPGEGWRLWRVACTTWAEESRLRS